MPRIDNWPVIANIRELKEENYIDIYHKDKRDKFYSDHRTTKRKINEKGYSIVTFWGW